MRIELREGRIVDKRRYKGNKKKKRGGGVINWLNTILLEEIFTFSSHANLIFH